MDCINEEAGYLSWKNNGQSSKGYKETVAIQYDFLAMVQYAAHPIRYGLAWFEHRRGA